MRPQVLTFQFATELIFIAIKPFGYEYFFMLFVKALLPILIKGGLIMDFHDFVKAKWEARLTNILLCVKHAVLHNRE